DADAGISKSLRDGFYITAILTGEREDNVVRVLARARHGVHPLAKAGATAVDRYVWKIYPATLVDVHAVGIDAVELLDIFFRDAQGGPHGSAWHGKVLDELSFEEVPRKRASWSRIRLRGVHSQTKKIHVVDQDSCEPGLGPQWRTRVQFQLE